MTAAGEIVRMVKHLPSSPRVLPRLKRLLRNGNSSIHEIVQLVRLDPGIAARVLQVANSFHFSKGVRSVTVDEAVRRVGYNEIYEVVSFSVASQVLVRPLVVYGIDADECWRSAVACGIAADEIAALTGEDRDAAYTVGLLHGIGMVAIDEWALMTGQTFHLATAGFPHETCHAEQSLLGVTHAETGGLLLQHWDFPNAMVEPVRCQYDLGGASDEQRLTALLQASKWVRSAVCAQGRSARPPLPGADVLAIAGIAQRALEGVVAPASRRLVEVSSLLESAVETPVRRNLFPAQRWRP